MNEASSPVKQTGVFRKMARQLKRLLVWLLWLFVAYQVWLFAHVVWWNWVNPSETSFMSLRLSELREKDSNAQLQFQWMPYDRISPNLKRAVVAAEDDKFVDHDGFDWDGIQHAIEKNQKKGKAVSGGSTISQQLSKNLFLSPSRSYLRKMEEAIITVMIEAVWNKQRILEVYLNVAEWGNGVFGAEAAAQHYYKTPAARLSAEQAAHLAVMLPNPRKYEKSYPPRLTAHSRRIQSRMMASDIP